MTQDFLIRKTLILIFEFKPLQSDNPSIIAPKHPKLSSKFKLQSNANAGKHRASLLIRGCWVGMRWGVGKGVDGS